MKEVKPIVTEEGDFEYQDKSTFLGIFKKIRSVKFLIQRPNNSLPFLVILWMCKTLLIETVMGEIKHIITDK